MEWKNIFFKNTFVIILNLSYIKINENCVASIFC